VLVEMMSQNTALTEAVKTLSERVERLTADLHRKIVET
jgi:hypothetical protein